MPRCSLALAASEVSFGVANAARSLLLDFFPASGRSLWLLSADGSSSMAVLVGPGFVRERDSRSVSFRNSGLSVLYYIDAAEGRLAPPNFDVALLNWVKTASCAEGAFL